MTTHHKVGEMHHYGKILADAYKYGNSGHTVTLYDNVEESVFNVVEWDKTGEYEISSNSYDNDEDAVISYLNLTFGVSL